MPLKCVFGVVLDISKLVSFIGRLGVWDDKSKGLSRLSMGIDCGFADAVLVFKQKIKFKQNTAKKIAKLLLGNFACIRRLFFSTKSTA